MSADLSRPRALGPSVLSARIRSEPEDFRVDEVLGFERSGSGEHLFVEIEKRSANTAWIAKQLAKWAGIAPMGVGYAGLKDRHAITRQWFSLHLPKRIAPATPFEDPEATVITQIWHNRKLPRGALKGNRFRLRLRALAGEHAAIEQRLAEIAARGVPNYFGAQRFGREGGNLDAARSMFGGRRVDREERSILLSSARSAIFNAVLAERVKRGDWEQLAEGEVCMLDGSHSVFGPEPITPALIERARLLDLHPTGPLWGAGSLRSAAELQALEASTAAEFADLCAGLEAADLRQERRALRLPVRELAWSFEADDALQLEFFLPAGAFATSVLEALGEIEDASGRPMPS
ncbi:tRNA pseudouridine(13) synthase TruD [Aquimonas sp.]|jgi:tRNA pseudouridine13 synthase|uniref:tRNA pseudouridine(13) synthase TruD n=1 Tax=Aquimonas sp. TaxID=1872588 RepID=UPI0037C0EFA0